MEDLLKTFTKKSQMGPTDTAEEIAKRRKPCACGYIPTDSNWFDYFMNPKWETCSNKLALRNHITFPSFEMMSDLNDPSMLYYKEKSIGILGPSRHWATLIEITHDLTFVRPRCSVTNQFGESFYVHFYHEKYETPVTFKWSQLKPGNTLAILYPEKKTFLDMTEGIRQEHLDSCYIFNSSLVNVQNEAQRLLQSADLEASKNGVEQTECFNCGVKTGKLSRCSACKLANYCSKECQTKAWKNGHKSLCKQSEVLLRLAVLPRYKFQSKHFSFNEHTAISTFLPPYKQIGATRRENYSKSNVIAKKVSETIETELEMSQDERNGDEKPEDKQDGTIEELRRIEKILLEEKKQLELLEKKQVEKLETIRDSKSETHSRQAKNRKQKSHK